MLHFIKRGLVVLLHHQRGGKIESHLFVPGIDRETGAKDARRIARARTAEKHSAKGTVELRVLRPRRHGPAEQRERLVAAAIGVGGKAERIQCVAVLPRHFGLRSRTCAQAQHTHQPFHSRISVTNLFLDRPAILLG